MSWSGVLLKEIYSIIFQISECENCLEILVGDTKFNFSKKVYSYQLLIILLLKSKRQMGMDMDISSILRNVA